MIITSTKNKDLKYPCIDCINKECEYRQDVTREDFKGGVALYCDHGFIRLVLKK